MRPFLRGAFNAVLFSGALFLLIGSAVAVEPRAALWNQAEAAMTNGLPKTAIAKLQIILDGALHDKAYAEAAKAMAQKITLESQSEKDANAAKVIRLEAALPNAPTQMRPILHTILALWYWRYFEDNRWRFAQRSATQSAPGNDFTTWDSSRLFDEIERQFQIALSADATLKAIPVSDWGDLLEKGDMADAARPTLYDFIAREALSFYTDVAAREPAKPENPFQISADDPVFETIEKFLAWQPQTADTNSPSFKAVQLWQDLLRFHENDPPPAPALSAADLDRLSWAGNLSLGDSDASYTNALRRFIQSHRDSEISSLARHREAVRIFWDGDSATAHRIAEEGERSFPKSPGGKLCHNLLLQIETKSAGISTELVWNAPWPTITVTYDNIDSIFFRAIPVNWEMFLDRRHNRPENLSDKERQEILRLKPALEWSARLPRTLDYKETNFDLTAPGTLKPGFYFIAASDKPGRARDSAISLTPVWVSDLSLVTRSRNGSLEGFVTEANSGEPVAGAKISAWRLDASGNRIAVPTLTSDTNGFFEMETRGEEGYLFLAGYHGQEISSPGDISAINSERQTAPRPVAVFYTDRSIYRPGQIVQFSGICFKSDQLLTGREVTVVFDDTNGKEIARRKCRVNDYGSFAGSFTAPRDRLMGEMNLRAAEGTLGGTTIQVEEYKRPKFEVTLDPPKSPPKLNDQVVLAGRAMGYSGAAVDGARVTYRVARQSRMPVWWWHPFDGGASQEIAHGSLKTAADGSFKIVFDAAAHPSISETNEPVFDFTINADVTDNAGETRSGEEVVRVGYTALQVNLAANDWETAGQPVALNVETTSLDDEPREAQGGIKIYSLQPPENIQRPSLNSGPPATDDWPRGNLVAQKPFSTGTNGKTRVEFTLPIGVYQVVLETKDRFGKTVTAKLPIRVIDPSAASLGLKIPSLLAAPQWEAQPGDQFMALWGTGYAKGRACVEIEHRDKIIRRYWTKPGRTEEQIHIAVDEAMRGGFTLHVTQIRENRAYFESHKIEVPWKNKELKITWEHFTSKLQPGQKESWTAVITGPKAERAAAEMVATLYDESLDAFLPLEWNRLNGIFYDDNSLLQQVFCNNTESGSLDFSPWAPKMIDVPMIHRHFPPDLDDAVGYINVGVQGATPPMLAMERPRATGISEAGGGEPAGARGPKIDLGHVAARKNLNETAFFFPQLLSDSNGVVRMTFTMPEALTRWHFMALAHDTSLRTGFVEAHAVTAKDLMVQPNPPRFLREDDTIEFPVKVSNQSDSRQTGTVRLTFNYAATDKSADAELGNSATEQSFDIPARESLGFSWRIHVPDGCGFLSYKAVGATDKLSDGEEGAIPVLSRRVLVTESLPLWITGPATNHFRFDKLVKSGASPTLQNESLTLQMVSNPAWYAIMALPYLMEFPHECSEQTFDRFYANALARHIAGSDPKIRRIFDLWGNTPALDSPLEKNQDLKSVMIEETPWLRDAQNESQARRNIAILFDSNRLDYETASVLQKLADMRLADGRWPWFPGGPGDDFITLYILTGFGRLRHLGVDVALPDLSKSISRMDKWSSENCRRIEKTPHPDDYVPTPLDAMYLYCRAFFLKDQPIAASQRKEIDFLLRQCRKFWLKTDCLQSQAQIALALQRWGGAENRSAAVAAMKSLKERSSSSDEMGMYWAESEGSWWWYRAPIETQTVMIEAFDEIMNDRASVDACQTWLLKQKQTQNWKTTKATSDAVYALLLRGSNLLSSDALAQTSLGGVKITPASAEAGTGFYEHRFAASEIKPALGDVTVKKTDAGPAWGGLHWQYLEDIAKITSHEDGPLKLKKTLWVKLNTSKGPVLKRVNGPLRVGDELVVRLELRTDRDMEYVHLKDQRGSGAEPVNVLSQYKYQDGLGYYESTRDTASHFFIDHLPPGTYVFEYSVRLQLRGKYQSGPAEIQCMYAPEFNSHSESFPLVVE